MLYRHLHSQFQSIILLYLFLAIIRRESERIFDEPIITLRNKQSNGLLLKLRIVKNRDAQNETNLIFIDFEIFLQL